METSLNQRLSNHVTPEVAEMAQRVMKDGFYSLSFPSELEAIFRDVMPVSIRWRTLALILGGLAMILASALWNVLLSEQQQIFADQLRYQLLLPMVLFVFIASFHPDFRRFKFALSSIVLLAIASSIITIMWFYPTTMALHLHIALVFTFVFGNLLLRLPFWYALGWVMPTLLYYATVFWLAQPVYSGLYSWYGLMMFATAFVVMSANFQNDYQSRHDFLQAVLLHYQNYLLNQSRLDLYRLTVVDSLTGLYNRRYFIDQIKTLWRHCCKHQLPLSVLIIDIDSFRNFNEHYGRQRGDQCLKLVAEALLRAFSRSSDLVARLEGDRFAVLLRDCEYHEAMRLARNFCHDIEAMKVPHRASTTSISVTVSIGVSCICPAEDVPVQKLLDHADQALEKAIEAGGNSVVYEPLEAGASCSSD